MDFYMKLSRSGYAQHHVHGFPDVHYFDDCGNLGRKPRNHNGAAGEARRVMLGLHKYRDARREVAVSELFR